MNTSRHRLPFKLAGRRIGAWGWAAAGCTLLLLPRFLQRFFTYALRVKNRAVRASHDIFEARLSLYNTRAVGGSEGALRMGGN